MKKFRIIIYLIIIILLIWEIYRIITVKSVYFVSGERSADHLRVIQVEEVSAPSIFLPEMVRLRICFAQSFGIWFNIWSGCWSGRTVVEFALENDRQTLTAHWRNDHEIDVTVPAKAHFETRLERYGDIVLHYQAVP